MGPPRTYEYMRGVGVYTCKCVSVSASVRLRWPGVRLYLCFLPENHEQLCHDLKPLFLPLLSFVVVSYVGRAAMT